MSNQQKLIKLIADHAYWSDEARRLKSLGMQHFAKCISVNDETLRQSCIDIAHQDYTNDRANGFYGIGFEEVYDDLVSRGEICEHCIQIRELRKQRMAARRNLGHIRSAITMAGRKLNKSSPEEA